MPEIAVAIPRNTRPKMINESLAAPHNRSEKIHVNSISLITTVRYSQKRVIWEFTAQMAPAQYFIDTSFSTEKDVAFMALGSFLFVQAYSRYSRISTWFSNLRWARPIAVAKTITVNELQTAAELLKSRHCGILVVDLVPRLEIEFRIAFTFCFACDSDFIVLADVKKRSWTFEKTCFIIETVWVAVRGKLC